MGKYMRKCRGAAAAAGGGKAAPAVVEHRAPVALGVRTRSRAAALDAKMRKQQTTSTTARAVEDALLGRDGGDAARGCYLQLRSRRLFMPAAAVVGQLRGQGAGEEASTAGLADSGPSAEAIVAGVSRCSSTASTAVDVAARERSGDEAEACESREVESSVSDSECGARDRRETTPSSRSPVDSSDLESSQAADEQKHKRRRYRPATTTTTATPFHLDLEARARMPPAAEIDEFFAVSEKAQAERFAAKYNFDVARGVPLNAGRFEWTPVTTV